MSDTKIDRGDGCLTQRYNISTMTGDLKIVEADRSYLDVSTFNGNVNFISPGDILYDSTVEKVEL